MPSEDPRFTLAATDYQNYLLAVDHPELGVDYRKEVDERLQKIKDKAGQFKHPTAQARTNVLRTLVGYRDSELGGDDRLGNSLEDKNPNIVKKGGYTNGKPPTLADLLADPTKRPKVEIKEVTPGARTITHTDKGKEILEAHEYMHEIFDYILYEARKLLEDINVKLQAYSETPNATTKSAYAVAVGAYNDFRASFPAPGVTPGPGVIVSEFASALNEVKFKPVITNEGFTVSLRVHLNWKNPRHSSSTIKVP